ARVAAALKQIQGLDVEVVDGARGEFTVLVDGQEVARKGEELPAVEQVVTRVKDVVSAKAASGLREAPPLAVGGIVGERAGPRPPGWVGGGRTRGPPFPSRSPPGVRRCARPFYNPRHEEQFRRTPGPLRPGRPCPAGHAGRSERLLRTPGPHSLRKLLGRL